MWGNIRERKGKYYKKFKPCGVDLVTGLVIAITIIFLIYQFVIRG
jgi:hypothetical protein